MRRDELHGPGGPTESTVSSRGEAGPSYPPCPHRARPQSVPCGHCAKINDHHALRPTISLTNGINFPACEHQGEGFLLPCDNCQEEKNDQYVRCRLLAENAAPFPADHFASYEVEVEKAEKEKRIFQRRPTPITWCIPCKQDHCKEDCGTVGFNREADALRGDTPVAVPAEEEYSSSETIRLREILYSPALVRKIETRNKAVQTKRSRTRNRATQTETEVIPPHASRHVIRIIYLVLLLAAVGLALTGLAAIPGAHARPLTAAEHFPSSSAGLLRSIVSISLVIVASKFMVTHVSAAVTAIPALPEPTTTAAATFVAAIAAGYLLVQRPSLDAEEAVEVVDQDKLANEQWVPFLWDIAAPEFEDFKKGLINDRHSKNTSREAIIALYARLQASLDPGNRQKEFISFLNNNPPGQDNLIRLSKMVGKEEGDWLGAIERAERWCGYTEYVQKRIWPLFPDVFEDERTSGRLLHRVDELSRLWHTVARNAAGYVFAHGLPTDTEKIEDIQHWVDAVPRDFEKGIALLFTPKPSTRKEILEKVRELVTEKNGE